MGKIGCSPRATDSMTTNTGDKVDSAQCVAAECKGKGLFSLLSIKCLGYLNAEIFGFMAELPLLHQYSLVCFVVRSVVQ